MNQNWISSAARGLMARAVATGLFVSRCTVQQPSGTLTASGAPDNVFTTVIANIRCMDAPEFIVNVRSSEMRAPAEIEAQTRRHVLLDGYYPTIITGWRVGWRAIVDGITYDIGGVEADSQRTQTRLNLQLVTT